MRRFNLERSVRDVKLKGEDWEVRVVNFRVKAEVDTFSHFIYSDRVPFSRFQLIGSEGCGVGSSET